MKKVYMIPMLQLSPVSAEYAVCNVSGGDGGGSGTGEGEEDLSKSRENKLKDDSWGNLW